MSEQINANESNLNKNENLNKANGCVKTITRFILQLLVLIIVFVITWHLAVAFTIKSMQSILGFTQKTVKEYILAEYGEGKKEQKFVVFTQEINVPIDKDEDNRILWDWISLGSARLKVKFIGNKVQYYVPMNEIKDEHILYDSEKRTIKIICPPIHIDKEMVFIQHDPDKIQKEENGSWSPLGPKMKDLNDEIYKGIKDKTLILGNKKEYRQLAQEAAKEKLEQIFNKVLGEFLRKENLNLEVILP